MDIADSSAGTKPAWAAEFHLEKELDVLQGDLYCLHARLNEDLRPQAAKGTEVTNELSQKVNQLKDSLNALAESRRDAAGKVGSLTKRQLAEVKQLARRPPEPIRRTLQATWLLLNSSRFRGSSRVHFDEEKVWLLCKRMLADDTFINRILEFDPAASFAEMPHVPLHIASTYLGYSGGEQETVNLKLESGIDTKETPSMTTSHPSLQRSASTLRRSKAALPKIQAPLDVDIVTRACEPCGALLQWIQQLVMEEFKRKNLIAELAPLEAELHVAEERHRLIECQVAENENAIASVRLQIELKNPKRLSKLQATPRLLLPPLPARSRSPGQSAATSPLTGRSMLPSPQKLGPAVPLAPLVLAPTPHLPDSKPLPRSQQQLQSLKPLLGRPTAAAHPIELDVTGRLTSVRQKLARLRIPFGKNDTQVPLGDLPMKIAILLQEHRGHLKIMLEGYRDYSEQEGRDIERSQHVARLLIEGSNLPGGPVPAGLLRVIGRAAAGDAGRCVVPVPIQELVPLYGPISSEVNACKAPVGLYFEDQRAELTQEASAILAHMAKWLQEADEDGTSCPSKRATVCIEGHIAKGEPLELAERRAQIVRDALVALGATRQQLRTQSRDASHPLSKLHAAPNRRAEIHLDCCE